MFPRYIDFRNLLLFKVNVLISWLLTEQDKMTFTFNFPNILKAAPWRYHSDSEYLQGLGAISFITVFLGLKFCSSVAEGSYSINGGLLNEWSKDND